MNDRDTSPRRKQGPFHSATATDNGPCLRRGLVGFLGIVFTSSLVFAEPANYAKDVKPLLKARCFACHGALKQQAGLRVDTVASLLRGGENGPALVTKNAAGSRLVERISASDLDLRMPPEGKPLTPEEIAKIAAWINEGAAAPEREEPEPDPRAHWSFQPPQRAAVPEGASHPIDAFLLAKLRQQDMTPRPLARPEIQLRRLYLDLIGLPPTAEELQVFLADQSPHAWETVVNRLLDDPRYGERWGRHWMDVWRYSDWYGRRQENDVRNSASQIWRWRDWIVRSLNDDHGYDRMLQEMLAADEIRPEDEDAAVATGYIIRNFYSLNANDWMRNVVEHTGKAFLGLTFNCAHCHDHKYDPITQDNYFQLRAVFEPVYIRQDRVAGEADPGLFQDYEYSGNRKVQRLGLVRIFDKLPDAPTWFYTGGDERNRVKDRGSIPPGVPLFLTGSSLNIQPVSLPPVAWYPGLKPAIRQTVIAEAKLAVMRAEQELKSLEEGGAKPSAAAAVALQAARDAFQQARRDAVQKDQPGALCGEQSLVLDATAGRRIVQNGLQSVKELPDGAILHFQMQLVTDAHFNFQFAKDIVKGLTAGYVAWEKGRIVSYQPGTFTEFQAGQYDFAGGQRQFYVQLKLETKADRCLLTIRSTSDDKVLVDQAPIALNGWNPVGDATKAISFDARTGSSVLLDDIYLMPHDVGSVFDGPIPLADFRFEAPVYANGRDVSGIDGWSVSSFSVAPATSVVSNAGANAALNELSRQADLAQRVHRIPELQMELAAAKLDAARAELASVEIRIAADRAKFGETPVANLAEFLRDVRYAERTAAVAKAYSEIMTQELALIRSEAKPMDDANRAKEIEAAGKKLTAARQVIEKADASLDDATQREHYTAFSPIYPQTSTGRRRAFAEWLTGQQHPLTARVAVNHIWARHFHAPLVSTMYDFGRNGALPTHPEVIDWLAVELMEHGWSMKHLHRLLVTSDAYRRVSSVGDASRNAQLDPENKLLWRMNAGRMESEVVRDSLLYCAGRLDLTRGGVELENNQSLTTFRRSLYYTVHPEGGGKSPLGQLFDAPDPGECYRRTRSIIPQQALALTNSDLVHQMSSALVAEWKPSQAGDNETDEFIAAMFRRILSRAPTDAETQICRESLASAMGADIPKARESLVRALFNHNDFITIR